MSSYQVSSGVVTVGEIASISGTGSSQTLVPLFGYAPITTDTPTVIKPNDYKAEISSKENVMSSFNYFLGEHFENYESYQDALSSDYADVKNNTVFVWGNYEAGGLGFLNNGNADACQLVMCFGIDQHADYVAPVINTLSLPYKSVVDNTGATHISNLETSVVANGTYDTGITIFNLYDFDDTSNNFVYNNKYAVCYGACEGQMGYSDGDAYDLLIYNVHFWDSMDNAMERYLDNFTDKMPSDNAILEYSYDVNRSLQRKINTIDLIMLMNDYNLVEDTSLWSGAQNNEASNPYPKSSSSGGGGYGSGNRYSESCGDDSTPDVDLIGTGLVDLYNLTKEQMQDFCNYLYSGITENIAATIKRLLANPLDGVITAHLVRFTPQTNATGNIKYCGFDTGVSAKLISKQYYSCIYEIDIPSIYNGFLDYNGNTKLYLYIPYIGFKELNMNDFVGGTLKLTMKFDILTGAVNAYVWAKLKQKGYNHVQLNTTVYEYTGNCAMTIPLSGTDWRNTFSTLAGLAIGVISQNPYAIAGAATSAFNGLVSMDKGTNVSANYGYMGDQKPYIIIEHPEASIPDYFEGKRGYKTNVSVAKFRDAINVSSNNKLNFIKVREGTLDLRNLHATDEEKAEIARMLYEGVYYEYH